MHVLWMLIYPFTGVYKSAPTFMSIYWMGWKGKIRHFPSYRPCLPVTQSRKFEACVSLFLAWKRISRSDDAGNKQRKVAVAPSCVYKRKWHPSAAEECDCAAGLPPYSIIETSLSGRKLECCHLIQMSPNGCLLVCMGQGSAYCTYTMHQHG